MRSSKRSVALLVAGMVAAAGLGVDATSPVGGHAAAAQTTTSFEVDPAEGLVDGQSVTVRGSGVGTQSYVLIAQCRTSAGEVFDEGCRGFRDVQLDPSGSFEASFLVRALGTDGVDCRAGEECILLAAAYDTAAGDYVEVGRVALAFDPTAPLAPPPTVTVAPSEGLVDGQDVTVTGAGVIGYNAALLQCATSPTGWNDCDDESYRYVEVAAGGFESSFRVRATITTAGGVVDCRIAGSCVIVAYGDSFDPAEAGVAALAFDPDAPLRPPPSLTLSPASDLVDGQTVTVAGSDFAPDSWGVQLFQCASGPSWDRCRQIPDLWPVPDAAGAFTVDVPVIARVPTAQGLVDCRTSPEPCVLVASLSGPESPRAGAAPLAFDPDGELLPGPVVEVMPADGLGDFTEVRVTGTGFTPGARVQVTVCPAGAVGGTSGCDQENGETPTADATGAIDTTIAVLASSTDWSGTTTDCRQPPGCELVATDGVRGLAATAALVHGPPDASRGRYLDAVFTDVEVTRDVLYRETVDHHGNPVELRLDIYRPAGDTATARPAIVWLYGGWFVFGDKSAPYIVDFATESARRGYVGVAVNYRVRPDMQTTDLGQIYLAMQDAHDDAVAAVQWLQAHAGDHGIDPDAIAAGGWSAGAVTSLNLAYMPGTRGPDTSPIAAALPVAGVIVPTIEAGEPPSLVFFATDDTTLPGGFNNTDTVCPAAASVGVGCELVTYDGASHSIIDRDDDIVRRSTDFLVARVLEPAGYFDVEANAGGPYEVDEGSSVTLDGSASTGVGLVHGWAPAERVDDAGADRPTLQGHDDGTEQLTLTVTNEHGVNDTADVTVTTSNVAPTIDDAAVTSGPAAGRTVSLAAEASDPGAADTHTVSVDWGDGTVEDVPVAQAPGQASVAVEHTYATGGRYEVEITVADDDGGEATWSGEVAAGCTITGTDRPDLLVGTPGDDVVCGLGGGDLLLGGDGDDVVLGGAGDDVILGGRGDDVLDGEGGLDLLLGGPGRNTCTGEVRLGCRRRPGG